MPTLRSHRSLICCVDKYTVQAKALDVEQLDSDKNSAMNLHFIWNPHKAASNLRKHGVSFADASQVFNDPLALTLFDADHSEGEERWVTLGQIKGRLVVVVHTWQEQGSDRVHVRIISAREATAHEVKQYEG